MYALFSDLVSQFFALFSDLVSKFFEFGFGSFYFSFHFQEICFPKFLVEQKKNRIFDIDNDLKLTK